jgi:hypothetical protein
MVLAAARRSFNLPDAPPLSPIHSLHCFIPFIEEVFVNPLSYEYFLYLKMKLEKLRRVQNKVVEESASQ